MTKITLDEKQVYAIHQRFSALRTLAKIGTGSKTNDQIILASLRDMERLLGFVYDTSQPTLFRLPKVSRRKSVKDKNNDPLFLAEISSFKPLL